MKRALTAGLALIGVFAATLTLGVGSASAGWVGISDIQYDSGGRTCTDGLEFSLTYYAATQIRISIIDVTDQANPVTVLPETQLAPLVYQPVPELFASNAYLASNNYRVLFPQPVAAGRNLSVLVKYGSFQASAAATVGSCTLGPPFIGFRGSVDDPPEINVEKLPDKNKKIKLKFELGGDYGLAIFSEPPTANPIPCSFPTQGMPATVTYSPTPLTGELKYNKNDRYVYAFRPDPSWTGCYVVWFRTTVDGLTHRALFDFR